MSKDKFIIEPHFRLQEWVAEEKGYFKDEGLDYDFQELIKSTDGAHHYKGDKVGAMQSFERGRTSNVSCACHWTVGVAASKGNGRLYAGVYSVAPSGVFVPQDSPVRKPEDLAGVPIAVGYQSGSHYSTIQALEQFMPADKINLTFADGMLFHRLDQLIDGKAQASALFSGPYYFAEQLGFRKVIDTTFMIATMVTGDPDPEEGREDREAAVIEQVAAREPAEDRRSAEAVVLRPLQVGADVQVAGLDEEGHDEVRGEHERDRGDHAEPDDPSGRVPRPEADEEQHDRRDADHVRVDQVREHQRRAADGGDDDAATAPDEPVDERERDEREVHAEELGEQTEAAPDVRVVLESVPEVTGEERRCRCSERSRAGGEPHRAHRPEDGQREREQEQVAHEVEHRAQRQEPERQPVEDDDGEVRELLVVEELRKAELELRDPHVERVLARRQRVAGPLDHEHVLGVVVDVREWVEDLGREGDGVHRDRDRDERRERDLPRGRPRAGHEGHATAGLTETGTERPAPW